MTGMQQDNVQQVAGSPAALPALQWHSQALYDVAAERRRQVEGEGNTQEFEDSQVRHELAHAAACYAYPELTAVIGLKTWPWPLKPMELADHRANYVQAVALLLAEIERLDRWKAQPPSLLAFNL